jgi:hypothetical protein
MTPTTLSWLHRDPFASSNKDQILQSIDDVVCQDDLRSFFPRVDSVARSNSCFLLRELISGPKITLEIRKLIYGIAAINDLSISCQDLDESFERISDSFEPSPQLVAGPMLFSGTGWG